MKRFLKTLLPAPVLRAYHRLRLGREGRRNADRTPEQVFTDIYRQRKWGGEKGGPFCSGAGSRTEAVVGPYVTRMRQLLQEHPGGPPRVVDLGCGDFTIGRQLLDLCADYTAADVVPDLIEYLQATVHDPRVRFVRLDITADELPPGDVCFVRQVFQHLSNAQIARVLPRLRQYPIVYVTEHYPAGGPRVVKNVDKVQGSGIRLYDNSGVYLDAPPFDVTPDKLTLVLEVPDGSTDPLYPAGVIRTYRLTS